MYWVSQAFGLTLNQIKDQIMQQADNSHEVQVKRVWEPFSRPSKPRAFSVSTPRQHFAWRAATASQRSGWASTGVSALAI
jgi:hypothetical protein